MLKDGKTVIQAIKEIARTFDSANLYYGHGTDNAWDEAVNLVLALLELDFDLDKLGQQEIISAQKINELNNAITKRIEQRCPLPYITHAAHFAGLTLYVDERVIIPRSPIAELIEQYFSPWLDQCKIPRAMLDMCTGSACIAILMAKYFENTQIDAVDISADTLLVAEINIKRYELCKQVRLIQSDLFDQVPRQQYDIIVCNPPYVDDEDYNSMPKEYFAEPHLALHAQDEGLAIVDRLLRDVGNYLTDDGLLIIEVGNSQVALEKKYPQLPFVWLEFERGGQGVFLLEKRML